MATIEELKVLSESMTQWRQKLHMHPELAYEEKATSDMIAGLLEEFGLEVHRGLADTGVVGTLRNGDGERAVGLRADMDALPLQEANSFEHRSRHDGLMHACGHDGHCAMLLGAAAFLAKNQRFNGTVHFIFQPAEEGQAGGRRMVEEGLFEQFPVDGVYGMHNWPGMPAGVFGVAEGPVMAASDTFEITIRGKGGHAAMPHQSIDPIPVAAELVGALQKIVSRTVNPLGTAVISVTQIHGGESWNIIPGSAVIRGTVRTFQEVVRNGIEARMQRMAEGIAAAHGTEAELTYTRCYPATVNSVAESRIAMRVAEQVAGPGRVEINPDPSMGSEDFAYMLQARPGCYVWLGNGPSGGGCMLHSPHYDFNDEILPVGAAYWVHLVEDLLS